MALKIVKYNVDTEEYDGFTETVRTVWVDLTDIPKEQLSLLNNESDDFENEIWYNELYSSLEKVFKEYNPNIVSGIEGESDFLTLHFDVESDDEGEKIKKYLTSYLGRITDKNILKEFSRLSEIEKFKGPNSEFYQNFFKKLHKNLIIGQKKKKSKTISI
jgi:hypothetical protein